MRLLLQRGLRRDDHQPADTEAARRAEQVRAEGKAAASWSCSLATSVTSATIQVSK